MSRIEEDREAARVQQELAEKRLKEDRVRVAKAKDSAFAQKLTQEDAAREKLPGKAIDGKSILREATSAFGGKLRGGPLGGEGVLGERLAALQKGAEESVRDTSDGRSSDGRATRKSLDERSEESLNKSTTLSARAKADVRADSGGGGQKGGGGDNQDDRDRDNGAQAFRLNPALMPPIPVAQPKETGASAKLRALANEIAQKIVERVRVGRNAEGLAEFQIDLRSNVLAGLGIKVSGTKGRIRAVFTGSDREVMKLLKEQSEGLKSALASRGLTLEELRFEGA